MSVNKKFHYKGYGGVASECEIRIYGNLVIITQTDANKGTSITNKAVHIAEQVIVENNLTPEDLIFVHHYDDTYLGGGKELCQLVQFNIDRKKQQVFGFSLHNPRFTVINSDILNTMIDYFDNPVSDEDESDDGEVSECDDATDAT